MKLLWSSLALLAVASSASMQTRAPVLVELFTSEGCSSCPPADKILEALDSRVIVLSEHVDYWDHQGWKDPYSSHAITQRQEAYSRVMNRDGIYTPEMVIDGEVEFVGNDGVRAVTEIDRALKKKKAGVTLTRSDAGLKIDVSGVPGSADVFLVFAEDHGATDVAAGENKGRQLHHVAMVRSIRKIGSVKKGSFTREVELPADTAGKRIVVFVQESGPGRVFGAALLEPSI